MNSPPLLPELPQEVWQEILFQAPTEDLLSARRVSHLFNDLVLNILQGEINRGNTREHLAVAYLYSNSYKESRAKISALMHRPIHTLTVSGLLSLSRDWPKLLEKMSGITKLAFDEGIVASPTFPDLTLLSRLTRLESIDCLSPRMKDATFTQLGSLTLTTLRHLTFFSLKGVTKEALHHVLTHANFPALISLDLNDFSLLSYETLSPLTRFTTLKGLSLWRVPGIGGSLTQLPLNQLSLETLDLSNMPNIEDEDLSILQGLTSLRALNLRLNPNLSEIGFDNLVALRALRELRVNSCYRLQDASIKKIATALTQLEALHVYDCNQIGNEGLQALTSLTTLCVLNIGRLTRLTDLSPLTCLTRLHDLSLRALTQLSAIDLRLIRIMTHLRKINLEGCTQLKPLDVQRLQADLKDLKIFYIPPLPPDKEAPGQD